MSTFGKNIFTQFKVWINPIDCSKEACPPPCSLVKKCDELDTETDLDSIEVRAWDTLTCIPDGGSNADEDFTLLPTNYTVPVKSYIPIYDQLSDNNAEWSGGRAVIDDLYFNDAVFRSLGLGWWSLQSDPNAMTTEDMVTLSDGRQMKGIDFCKTVYGYIISTSSSDE